VSTGRIVSFEALVRWEHSERGILEPGDFLSIAEETDLIVLIGEWVLREVCRQGRIWQERYAQRTSPRVSMNVSPRQFLRSELIEAVIGSLEESGLEANNLSLEIAESGLMDAPAFAIERLRALKDLGVHVGLTLPTP
jgi:EAL domain-containing protein (putative c-di-GMP-specific phosphodiesterase class I)